MKKGGEDMRDQNTNQRGSDDTTSTSSQPASGQGQKGGQQGYSEQTDTKTGDIIEKHEGE